MVRGSVVAKKHRQFVVLGVAAMFGSAVNLAGCSANPTSDASQPGGSVGLALTFPSGDRLDFLNYAVTGNGYSQNGTINISQSNIASALIGGIPVGTGYTLTLTGSLADAADATCVGQTTFSIVANATTTAVVTIRCTKPRRVGSVLINGSTNECPNIDSTGANPAKAGEGGVIPFVSSASDPDHLPSPLSYQWSTTHGLLSNATSPNPTLTCNDVSHPTVTLSVSDGDPSCTATTSIEVICVQCLGEGTKCDDHNVCTLTDTCHSETCIGSNPAPARTPCAPQKICDGAGACVECLAPSDCPGQDNACATRTCTAGVCGAIFAPAGPAPTQSAGDCKVATCDGAGHLGSVVDNNDLPVDGTVCTFDVCTNGTPSNPPAAYGATCSDHGGQICSGDGTCDPITFDVVRVGDGTSDLNMAATKVFIERHKLDGSLYGTPNTVALPTSASGANQPFTTTGTTAMEAMLSRSADGHYLSMIGYGVAPGFADPVATVGVNRVIARINASGAVDTSTVMNSTAFLGQDVRTATSVDGTSFWAGGQGNTPSNAGIWYVPFGANGGGIQLSTAPARTLGIFANQLLGTADMSVLVEVYKVGSGLPTTGSPTITGLSGLPSTGSTSPFGFVMFDLKPGSGDPTAGGLDTLYVANATSNAGIQKWVYNDATSSWGPNPTKVFQLSPPGRGLTGIAIGSTVTLIATTAGMSTNKVFTFVDDGSANVVGTQILIGSPSLVYRGVALPPFK